MQAFTKICLSGVGLAASLVAASDSGSVALCSLAAKCKHGSECKEGPADYGPISRYPYESSIPFLEETARHGNHCAGCPEGHTGVTCKHKYEVCDEATGFACFHGSKCVQLGALGDGSNDGGEARWGCDCIGSAAHYAGTHCEHHWTDICRKRNRKADEGQGDLEEDELWFCTNGGICLEDESDRLRKCHCRDPWTGPRCEFLKGSTAAFDYESTLRDSCSLDCKNGGECTLVTSEESIDVVVNDGIRAFFGGEEKRLQKSGMYCACLDGYSGDMCETRAARSSMQKTYPSSRKFVISIVVISAVLFCLVSFILYHWKQRSDAVHAHKPPRKGHSTNTLDTQADCEGRMPKEDLKVVVI